LLDDPYPVVRYASLRSFQKLPGFDKFSYNFVADKDVRQQAKERAVELWRKQTRQPFGEAGRAIFLDEQGQLKVEALEELSRRRDDRPVEINE
jgi:DNA transposition AAA+ family ATPase